MNERDKSILEAAYRVFARFGVSKTTMADIATEAGVARQTVYNAYQNKEDLLRAVIRKDVLATEGELRTAWSSPGGFEDKLQVFFDLVPLTWFDSIQESPQAADLLDGIHRIAGAELDDAGLRYRSLLTDLVDTHFETSDPSAAEVADFIFSTAANAKIGVQTRTNLEKRLHLLNKSLQALLAQSARE